ncbi:MAG TPA: hypothetical protein VGZ29_09880 [Terriglobia bacterium]|nr:hypothetical protein [Terriglobia bacterium]
MKRRAIVRVVGLVAFLLAGAGIGLAHEVFITYQAKLGNGPELQAGTYRVEIVKNQDLSEVAFYQGKELIAQVPITIVMESQKSRHTEVHFESLDNGRVINQIRVAGWKETLVFREPAPAPVTG